VEGRNANRRVLLVILAAPQSVDAVPGDTVVADAPADAHPPHAVAAVPAQGAAKLAGVD